MPTSPTHYKCPLCNNGTSVLQDTNGLYECPANRTGHLFVLRNVEVDQQGRRATTEQLKLVHVTLGSAYLPITMTDMGPGSR